MIDSFDVHVKYAAESLAKQRYEIFRESECIYRFSGSGSEELFYLGPKVFMASGTCGSFVMDRREDHTRMEDSAFLRCKDRFFILGFTCGHTQYYSESVAKEDVKDLLGKLHGDALAKARELAKNCFASKCDHPRVQLFLDRLKGFVPEPEKDLLKPGIGWKPEPGFIFALAMLRLVVADREKILAGESIYRGGDSK